MRDDVSTSRVQQLHPAVRQEVFDTIVKIESGFPVNIRIRIAQGLRTFAEQDALFKQRPRVTRAKAGSSFHNYGLAIDFCLLYDKDNNGQFEETSWDTKRDQDKDGIIDWQEVVTAFEAIGWQWGGKFRTFTDMPHVQKTFGYKWQQLLAKYNGEDFIPGTHYVNL